MMYETVKIPHLIETTAIVKSTGRQCSILTHTETEVDVLTVPTSEIKFMGMTIDAEEYYLYKGDYYVNVETFDIDQVNDWPSFFRYEQKSDNSGLLFWGVLTNIDEEKVYPRNRSFAKNLHLQRSYKSWINEKVAAYIDKTGGLAQLEAKLEDIDYETIEKYRNRIRIFFSGLISDGLYSYYKIDPPLLRVSLDPNEDMPMEIVPATKLSFVDRTWLARQLTNGNTEPECNFVRIENLVIDPFRFVKTADNLSMSKNIYFSLDDIDVAVAAFKSLYPTREIPENVYHTRREKSGREYGQHIESAQIKYFIKNIRLAMEQVLPFVGMHEVITKVASFNGYILEDDWMITNSDNEVAQLIDMVSTIQTCMHQILEKSAALLSASGRSVELNDLSEICQSWEKLRNLSAATDNLSFRNLLYDISHVMNSPGVGEEGVDMDSEYIDDMADFISIDDMMSSIRKYVDVKENIPVSIIGLGL